MATESWDHRNVIYSSLQQISTCELQVICPSTQVEITKFPLVWVYPYAQQICGVTDGNPRGAVLPRADHHIVARVTSPVVIKPDTGLGGDSELGRYQ